MEQVTDDDVGRRLEFDNPWWRFQSGTKVRFRQPPKRALFDDFLRRALAPDRPGHPLVLSGPARSGKTVLMRQALAEAVRRGISPMRILYVSFGTPAYAQTADLGGLIAAFLDRFSHSAGQRLFLFLDDVHFIKDWRHQLVDLAGQLPASHILVTVSAGAPALASGVRTEDNFENFALPPLSFLEFLRFRETETTLIGSPSAPGEQRLDLSPQRLAALNGEFHRYLNFGGWIEGLTAGTDDAPAPTFVRDHLAEQVLHTDLAVLHGVNDPQELLRLFTILARNTASEVAIEELACAAGIAKNTLRKYLDYLEAAFLIRRVPRLDRDGRRFQRQVLFKVYLTSPTFYAALFGPVLPSDAAYPSLVETAVASQYFALEEGNNLAYASWKGGTIDFILMDAQGQRPDVVFEFDWPNNYAKSGKGPDRLVSFIERTNAQASAVILTGALARPGQMRRTKITLVPAAVYAYSILHGRTAG